MYDNVFFIFVLGPNDCIKLSFLSFFARDQQESKNEKSIVFPWRSNITKHGFLFLFLVQMRFFVS